MPEEVLIFVLALMSLSSFTAIAIKALNVWAMKLRKADSQEAELTALRQDVASLRAWANEANTLLLASDSALQQQERRLHSIEQRALRSDSPAAGAGLVSATARTEPETLEARPRA